MASSVTLWNVLNGDIIIGQITALYWAENESFKDHLLLCCKLSESVVGKMRYLLNIIQWLLGAKSIIHSRNMWYLISIRSVHKQSTIRQAM